MDNNKKYDGIKIRNIIFDELFVLSNPLSITNIDKIVKELKNKKSIGKVSILKTLK